MSNGEMWALYRQALDASMDGMALLDAAGRYVYVNAAHAAVYGFPNREELIGQSWRILYDEEGLNYIDKQIFPVLQDQGKWHGRAIGMRRDGSLFPQELSLAFLPDGGLVCVVRDIADRIKSEELANMSERIIERSSSVVFRCEPTPRWPILYVSANVIAWGYRPEDLLSGNLSFVDILHADDIQRIQAESARFHATSLTRWHQQYRIRTADGTVRYVEDETFVMRNPDGSVQYIEGVLHDVTDRRASEAQIAQLGQLVDESSDEIYVFDSDSLLFVQANRRAQQNLGYSLEELRQMKPVDVAPEMTAERLAEALEPVRNGTRSSALVHTPERRRDGTTYPVEARLSLVETGGRTAVVAIVTDISERLAAEAERTRILSAMDQVSEGIIILDEDQRLQYANQALEHILGAPAGSILGKTVAELPAPPGLEGLYRRAAAVVLSGETWTGTLALPRSDGTPLTLRVSVRAMHQADGQPQAYCAVIHDATEEVRREDELRQSQKMEAIGQLAGGVAHDFNNLLTAIMGYASLLMNSLPPDSPEAEAATTINQASVKAADLTRRLLGFARKGKIEDIPVNLHTVIHDVHSLLERTLPGNVVVAEQLDADEPSVMGDATQLQQVLLNLAINARDAMPEGGTLSFKTRNVHLDASFCRFHPGSREGAYVQTDVQDTGCGIPEGNMPHMFEPFFTTKKAGEGTGMGLPMVYGIVHNHGGSVHVYSEEGKGTMFRVYLPSTQAAAAPSGNGHQEPVRGHGRILVVDDEAVVRKVSADILRHLGYEVEECTSGNAAVTWYAAQPREDRPDLVVIDLSMPGMDGIQTVSALREVDSGVRALLSTGFGLEGRLPEATAAGFTGWVQKPFHPYELSIAVAQALDTLHES
jgi:PAS domain S-box-containing protein